MSGPLRSSASRPASSHRVPIVINNNNFAKGGGETPCLLSFDDALTLFHEMGHGLHGMLSSVRYSRLAGPAPGGGPLALGAGGPPAVDSL